MNIKSLFVKKRNNKILGISALAITFVFFVLLIFHFWNISVLQTQSRALINAKSIQTALNRTSIKDLTGTAEDLQTEPYTTVKSILNEVTSYNEGIKFACIYRLNEGNIIILVDSLSEDYSEREYANADNDFVIPFESGESLITNKSLDNSGNDISILIPMKDRISGEIYAVFAVDYPLNSFYADAIINTLFFALICFFVILLSVAMFFILQKNRKIKQENIKLLNAEEQITKNAKRYKSLIENMQEGLAFHKMIYDDNGKAVDYKFISVNKSFEELTGLKAADIVGKTVLEVLPDTEKYWIETYDKVARTGKAIKYENYAGELKKHYSVSSYCPEKGYFATIIEDITMRRNAEEKIKESERKYRHLAENISDVVWSMDLKLNTLYISPSVKNLCGYEWEEYKKLPITKKHPADELVRLQKILSEELENDCKDGADKNRSKIIQTKIYTANGEILDVELNISFARDKSGKPIGFQGVTRDITKRKRIEDELLYLVSHDELTGLYNRRYYQNKLTEYDKEENLPIAVIIADINGLTLTNEAFGYKAGDNLIKKVADILSSNSKQNEIIARTGGDEFVILIKNAHEDNVLQRINDLNKLFENLTVNNIILSVSFGYAVKKESKEDIKLILKIADDDLNRHKLTENSSMRSKTINIIMNSLFEKNQREMIHSKRVSEISEKIAKAMNLKEEKIKELKIAALMHDIGKIGISDNILNKEGKLEKSEWNEIKKHPEIGYRLLSSVNEFSRLSEYVLAHHERYDGKGYPKGLKGKEIPLEARIMALADCYDAMTNDRTYRKAMSREEAKEELTKNAGTQFDKDIVKVFIDKVIDKIK